MDPSFCVILSVSTPESEEIEVETMQSFNEPELLKWSAQKTKKTTRLTEAVEAIRRLTLKGLNDTFLNGQTAALAAHAEIEVKPVSQRLNVFYRHFLPFLTDL